MAMHQYIGARYVPQFYDGSSGTDWTANTQYEALTVVTRNGNSYTSKKPVPASVGAPESNPAYWASTGIYSAQVQQIQDDLDIAEANIAALQTGTAPKRRFILIGDSYGRGVQGPGQPLGNGWTYYFQQIMGLSNDDCTISCADGAGFIGNSSTTFTDLITAANAPDPNTITDIIVAGGRNDETITGLGVARNTFYTTAKAAYPNARLWICFCGSYRLRTTNLIDVLHNVRAIYYGDTRWTFIPQASSMLNMNTTYYGPDATHFTSAGYTLLGQWIANAVNGGEPQYERGFQTQFAMTADSGNDVSFSFSGFKGRIYDRQFYWMPGVEWSITFGATKPTGGQWFKIADVAAPAYGGYADNECVFAVTGNGKISSGFFTAQCSILIKNGEVYIKINNGNPSGSGYMDLSTLTSVFITPGMYMMPLDSIVG